MHSTPETLRRRQSKKGSLAEAVANTAIGYVIAWAASLFFFWLLNIKMSMHDLWWYTWFMTLISVIRGYYVRRLWETEWWKRFFSK